MVNTSTPPVPPHPSMSVPAARVSEHQTEQSPDRPREVTEAPSGFLAQDAGGGEGGCEARVVGTRRRQVRRGASVEREWERAPQGCVLCVCVCVRGRASSHSQ